jgi:periplasmic protein TonB
MSEWVRSPTAAGDLDAPSPALLEPKDRSPARRDDDPFAAVMTLGDRAIRTGAAIGVVVALLSHSAAPARAMVSLYDLLKVTQQHRAVLHEYFWATYDIDTSKPEVKKEKEPEPPPPPPPEPEPDEPKAAPTPQPQSKADPYDPPPTPAKAAAALTRKDDPSDKIEDMTDTVVSSDGTATHGQQSASGKGDTPVTARTVSNLGTPGGTGTGAPKAGPPSGGPGDRTKPPGLLGGSTSWNCPFPPEADSDQIDEAVAVINITVRADGTPASVSIVTDPGHGFGRAARMCALARRYTPGLDREGNPTTATTPPVRVRFTR